MRNLSSYYIFLFYVFLDPLSDGLSSHSVLGHSPAVGQGARETDVTSVEFSKDNKRSHTDRGTMQYYV